MICIADGTLQAQLDGELTRPESLAVEHHLAECADCRRRADEFAARAGRVQELVYELSPLPGEVSADPFLALARFKARLAAEGGQVPMHTLTSIQELDPHLAPQNGHQPSAQVEAALLNYLPSSAPEHRALSFAVPESGSLIARLIAAMQQFARDFGKSAPRLHSGDTGEFHFLLADETLLERFKRELRAAAQEFKRNPQGFLAAMIRNEGGMPRRHPMMQAGAAMAVIAYAFIFTGLVVAGLVKSRVTDGLKDIVVVHVPVLIGTPSAGSSNASEKGKENSAGSKSRPDKNGGGGGGGRNQKTEASKGNIPTPSLTEQIVMPNPELPKIKNPSLPVAMTVYADPRALPEFKGGPIGLPTGVEGPPSSGIGSGAGIGNGKGTGVGPGQGPGVGPGRDGNTGGEGFNIGGPSSKREVYEAGVNGAGSPKILYKERARYTEEARQNRVQGTVLLSAVFTTDGRVIDIRVVRGLPDGLSETAIEAAQKIRFQPATNRNGMPITVRATIEFNFAIY
jgi:TonB family protein